MQCSWSICWGSLTHSPQILTSAPGNEGHSPILGAHISAPAAVWRGGCTASCRGVPTCLPVIPAAIPTSTFLAQLQIRVVLPKKTNVQQVTGIDQGFMIIALSHPYSLLCRLHVCKVIQSKARRNSVSVLSLCIWWGGGASDYAGCKW